MALRGGFGFNFNWKKFLIIIGVLIIVIGGTLATILIIKNNKGNNQNERYRVQGHVIDQYDQAVSGVEFSVGNRIIYTTGINGRFSLENLVSKTKIQITPPAEYLIENDEIIVQKNITITFDDEGLVINAINQNEQVKQIKIKTVDINNTTLNDVEVYDKRVLIDKTNNSGILNINVPKEGLELSFKLTNYRFTEMTIPADTQEKEITIKGTYLGSQMANVVNFIFLSDNNEDVIKNVTINYQQGNRVYSNLSTNGGFIFNSLEMFSNFTAFCEIEHEGQYYFYDYIGYCNESARFKATKGYKIEIEIVDQKTDFIYLKDLIGNKDKVYRVNNNKVTLYLADLNYAFYTEYDSLLKTYDNELTLSIDINTVLDHNMTGLKLQ